MSRAICPACLHVPYVYNRVTFAIDDMIYCLLSGSPRRVRGNFVRKMLTNQIKGRVSLLSAIAAMTMFPVAAMAEEAAGEDSEQERSRREDIIVTARSLSSSDMPTATPVQVLSGDELAHRRQGGLGETLAGLPGVHLDNFGAGASRPVIRGQTVPRIEILSDGANLFDASSVSPDHAITTEPLLLDGIEVLRGPAAVRFGGNAVNGAVNLIDSKVAKALPEGGFSGATEIRYGTGDKEKSLAGRITAGIGPFAVHAEGSRHVSDDYDVPDGYGSDKLKDSFAESTSYAFGASLITSKGYIGASYTRQDSDYGLPGHSHVNAVCHTHGLDLHCGAHGPYDNPFFDVADSHTASINLRNERVDVRGDFIDLLPGFSNVRLRGSYTDYLHDEIDGPRLFARYTNEVYDGRIELTHKPLFGFTGTLGVQYTDGKFDGLNQSDRHRLPIDFDFDNPPEGFYGYSYFLPPFYQVTKNWGVFLSERRSFGALDIEIAARKDWRRITQPVPENFLFLVDDETAAYFEACCGSVDAIAQRLKDYYIESYPEENPGARHNPFSASIGATWNVGAGYSAALSLAHTERAPNVRELYAYGNNLATNSYELGLTRTHYGSSTQLPPPTTDVMETTRSVNLTFRKVGGALEFEVGLFYQDVKDYIFARLIETEDETGFPHNYLVYTAADATFKGIDGQVSYRLSPESRVTVFGDYVDADLKNQNDHLPRIPPGRLGARYGGNWGPLAADLEYYRAFAQNRFASYETRTGGYNMVNATLAYRFDVGLGKSVEFYARGTNLTNELAFAHTSFVKNQSPLRGSNIVLGMRHQF